MESLDIKENPQIKYKLSVDRIKNDYVKSWHHPQKDMNFDLSSLNGQTAASYNNKDRDKKTLYNGQIKYFRDYNGYLYRGQIYHNINNMWWVIVNDTEYTNKADFDLFDLSPDDKLGRLMRHRPPKEYAEKRKILSQISNKELEHELKRRRKAS